MNIRDNEDPFAKNAQSVSRFYHEVLILMKFLQTKPQVKNMILNYSDLYYTVIKNRDEEEIVDNKYENDFLSFNDIVPNFYIGVKNDNEKKLR